MPFTKNIKFLSPPWDSTILFQSIDLHVNMFKACKEDPGRGGQGDQLIKT